MISHIELGYITYKCLLLLYFFPEMMLFIPKHVEYNYHHYAFIRTTLAQNTTTALSVMWSTGSHLGFYIDIMVVFQNIVRNAFLAPKYPRVEVLVLIIAPQGQFLHWGAFSLGPICSFTPCACIQYGHKNLSNVTKAATKLHLLIYPPRKKNIMVIPL